VQSWRTVADIVREVEVMRRWLTILAGKILLLVSS